MVDPIDPMMSVEPLPLGRLLVCFPINGVTSCFWKGGENMEITELKKIMAGIAATSLLAGATLSVGGCKGNSG